MDVQDASEIHEKRNNFCVAILCKTIYELDDYMAKSDG